MVTRHMSRANHSLSTSDDSVRVLGATGGTVVYICPAGQAIAERKQPQFPSHPSSAATATPPAAARLKDENLLRELVNSGTISAVQKDVVLYDQKSTGLSIVDILTARGWL